jgi:hypothetical protein
MDNHSKNMPVTTARVIQPDEPITSTPINPYPYHTRVIVTNDLPRPTPDMIKTYGLSRMLRILCGIDAFFSFLFGLSSASWLYFLAFVISMGGYYGAKNYNRGQVICYGIFNVIKQGGEIGLCIYLYTNTDTYDWYLGFSTAISTLITIWIIRIIYNFSNSVKNFTPEEKLTMKLLKERSVVYW